MEYTTVGSILLAFIITSLIFYLLLPKYDSTPVSPVVIRIENRKMHDLSSDFIE